MPDAAQPPVLHVISSSSPATMNLIEETAALSALSMVAGTTITAEDLPPSGDRPQGIGLEAYDVATMLAAGEALTDRAVDAGEKLVLLSASSDPIAVSAIAGTICRTEPVSVVTQGTSVDIKNIDDWRAEVLAVRDAMFHARGYRSGPWDAASVREILRILGTRELAITVGALAQASSRRTPVILDGMETLVAALLAEAFAPGSADWWLVPHIPRQPAGKVVVQKLGLSPILDRDLGAPRGGAGMAVLPLLRAAVAAH